MAKPDKTAAALAEYGSELDARFKHSNILRAGAAIAAQPLVDYARAMLNEGITPADIRHELSELFGEIAGVIACAETRDTRERTQIVVKTIGRASDAAGTRICQTQIAERNKATTAKHQEA